MTDVSYPVVRAYVSTRRPQIRAEGGRGPVQAFVTQSHLPGAEAEVDFGEVVIRVRGEPVTCFLFGVGACAQRDGVAQLLRLSPRPRHRPDPQSVSVGSAPAGTTSARAPGARASELLSVTRSGVDPGRQLITVVRKGSRELQELPASTDAFVWLRFYQVRMGEAIPRGGQVPLWWTLRSPCRPLTYHAVHRMFERVNARAGTSATFHALWHTAAYRMAEDPSLPLTDVHPHWATRSRRPRRSI
jgi:Phage integrase family